MWNIFKSKEDKETSLLTRMLFPRIDPYDSSKRLSIPSYVNEFYKIASHLGVLNAPFEPSKLVTGRVNGLVSKVIELSINKDFKGEYIVDPDDPLYKNVIDGAKHMFPIPISAKNIANGWDSNKDVGTNLVSGDFWKNTATGIAGFTDAPANAKRSQAANLAYTLSRNTYGKTMGHEEATNKDAISHAMKDYSNGDRTALDKLFADGKISEKTYKHQLAAVKTIDGKENPDYKTAIERVTKDRLTVEDSIKVYKEASAAEKKDLQPIILQKYINMMGKQDKGTEAKKAIQEKLKEIGIL